MPVFILGYFGESLPYASGLTSVIKGHGYLGTFETFEDTDHQMTITHGNAILLIRNPYSAIYGFRHYYSGGHLGYAYAENFFCPGTSGYFKY